MLQEIINIISIVFFGSEILLFLTKKSKSNVVKIKQDKKSMQILWGIIMVAVFGSMYLANLFPKKNPMESLQWTGVGILAFGIIFRMAAIGQLGKSFTVDVSISEGQKIKDNGLYKYIRHPSYLGSLLEFLGLSLLFNSWFPLLTINIPVLIAFVYRMKIEEELLLQFFGKEYAAYITRTKRIIPFVY